MKLAGLRLRVIWTLPVFYYLDLRMIEIKNCARVCLFSYLDLGKDDISCIIKKESERQLLGIIPGTDFQYLIVGDLSDEEIIDIANSIQIKKEE